MSLRGPATQHLHNEARRAEFDGTDGTNGPEKCPLKIFILCKYIDKVYKVEPREKPQGGGAFFHPFQMRLAKKKAPPHRLFYCY